MPPVMLDVIHTVASTRADHGGPSRSVPFLCNALVERDVSVRLVTAAPDFVIDRGDAILPAGAVETILVREQGWVSRLFRAPVAFYQALREQVEHALPELIHDHGLWLPTNGTAAFVAHRFDIPLVISTRGMLTSWALQHNRWKKRLAWGAYQKHVLGQAALFHVTSHEEVEALRDLGFDQPAAVIPNGVPLPEPTPPKKTSQENHRALFLSRLHPKKGLPMLIEAWAEVRPEDWELVLVGPSENGHRGELERQIRRQGLDDDVRISGPVSDQEKWEVYRSADLFILPTHSENFGIVVAEALASRVPVITTRGAPWQELEEEKCGWWVHPTVGALTGALREAVSLSEKERSEMGERGRTLVEENYSWPGVARQMEAAYRWLLHDRSRPEFVQAR